MNSKIKGSKSWSIVSPVFWSDSPVDGLEGPEVEEFEWPESICDLTDFTPLAELVRSFQPQDSNREPEFEYPDGVAPDGYEPPSEYDDITDASVAARERIADLKETAASRRKSLPPETPALPEKSNADAPEARLEKAVETAESKQ